MILSVDASLTSSGWAVVDDDFKIIDFGKIQTTPNTKNRYSYIFDSFENIFKKYKIDVIKIEEGFAGPNRKTSLAICEVRAMIKVLSDKYNCKIYLWTPCSIKLKVVGKGNCSKEDTYNKMCELYKNDEKFKLIGKFCSTAGKNKTEDIYDALSIARMPIK